MKLHRNFLICLLAVTAVLLCLLAVPQTAHAASESDLRFTLNETSDGYIVSDCNTYATGELVIPATYNGKPVTGIGNSAFYGCSGLTSITIPEGVTSIGYGTFEGCTSLTSVTIPSSVTSIDGAAFYGCESLASIQVAEGNPVYHSTGNCLIETASKTLIAGCKTSQIPADGSVTSIGDIAFLGCTSLTGITIPDSVTSIGNSAFSRCDSLTSITIPDSVTSIGYGAFTGCSGLTSVTIPSSVTSIDEGAFYGCDSLTSITIPDSVTSIGDSVFSNCKSLTSITIPDSVTSIGNYAFYYCYRLTSITIPDSVTSIGNSAFSRCDSLTSITYCGTQKQWGSIKKGNNNTPLTNAALQFHNFENGICTACGYLDANKVLTFTLNDTGDGYIVSDCDETATGELVIPATYNGLPVISIGEEAFSRCTSLTSITIPNSVTSIASGAFGGCIGLTDITVPEGVTTIGSMAFVHCTGLRRIVFPSTLSYMGYAAFFECEALQGVYISDMEAWLKLKIGRAAWGSPDNPLHYAGNLYLNGELVTELVVPDGITTIGYQAFAGCISLTSITIPDSVTSIGEAAFSGCTGLTNVTIGKGVASINMGAFSECTGLSRVIFCKTQADWGAIEISIFNEPLTNATLKFHDYEDGACTICGHKKLVAGEMDGNAGVDHNDAIYLLLNIMFGEEEYPLSGADGDIDGNGVVEQDDAVYLLLHSLFGEAFYPLKSN